MNSAPSSLNGTGSSSLTLPNGSERTRPGRSESMAYPKHGRVQTLFTKVQFYSRQNTKALIASVAFLVVLLVISSDALHDGMGPGGGSARSYFRGGFGRVPSEHWGGAMHAGSFSIADSVEPANGDTQVFHFSAVSDLDELSKIEDSKKPKFKSVLMPGKITRTGSDRYDITFEEANQRLLITSHNEAGRGGEFSELTIYNDRLLTFDDRTGDVFEVINNAAGTESIVVPRFVITEGEGDTDKGMKWEWATVKDGELYMGSMGKEYTKPDGTIVNTNNLWIGILGADGSLRREDWQEQYGFVRKALGASAPGYLIMEAVLWSDHWNKWIFLPRRISSEPYDDVKDEHRGGTKLVMVDKHFTNAEVVDIQMTVDGLRGFSSFAFVPGTQDRHALAIRSVEEGCADDEGECKQRSYFLVFDVRTGKVLSDEIQIPVEMKFEGVEFVNIYSKPKWA